jgi:hypothetical protein
MMHLHLPLSSAFCPQSKHKDKQPIANPLWISSSSTGSDFTPPAEAQANNDPCLYTSPNDFH